MKTQILLLFTIVSVLSSTYGKSPTQFFCGRRLSNTLAMFCTYDEVSKRSENSLDVGAKEFINDLDSNKALAPEEGNIQWGDLFQGTRLRRSMEKESMERQRSIEERQMKNSEGAVEDKDWKMQMLQGYRHKRGIIAECCEQPCTLEELLTYC